MHWLGYGSETSFEGMPDKPTVLQWQNYPSINSYVEAVEFITSSEKLFYLQPRMPTSLVAAKAKQYLNENFREPVSIYEMASELGFSYSTMTQYFKRSYGLSPQEYLKRLRVMYSIHLIKVGEQSVSASCFDSGFSDLSRFSQHFKSTLGAAPSRYESR